ncbi:MAG: hypothetical protein IVW36_12410 [Dehalococcoidia bacterium]|nr:hypothetical protein [Dehalococcoidia bacterium]
MKDVWKIGCGVALGAAIIMVVAVVLLVVALAGVGAAAKHVDDHVLQIVCSDDKTQGPLELAGASTRQAQYLDSEKTPALGLAPEDATAEAPIHASVGTTISGDVTRSAQRVATAAHC